MPEHEAEELFDPQKGLPEPDRNDRGDVSLGNEREAPTVSEGDSPNRGSVDGPLAPEPRPAESGSGESDAAEAERPPHV